MGEVNHKELLSTYAQRFRNAIIKSSLRRPATMENFPTGSCGTSSWLLGRFLRENGYEDAEYINGRKIVFSNGDYVPQSHAWIEVGGWVVDITANQFEDIENDVIVTNDKSWHNNFKNQGRTMANYRIYESPVNDELDEAYEIILKNLK